jgi:hypothetical protein
MDTPLLQKLKEYLQHTSQEDFLREWEAIKSEEGYSPDIKTFILNQLTMNKEQLNQQVESLKQEAKAIQERIEKIESLMTEPEVWIPEKGEPAIFSDSEDNLTGLIIRKFIEYNFGFVTGIVGTRWKYCRPLFHYIYQKPNPNWKPTLNEVCIYQGLVVQIVVKVVGIIGDDEVKIKTLKGSLIVIPTSKLSQLTLNSF